ncbi:hypothetical protein [Natrarchaeobius halalkaliphilus]|uniref:hypothetical protein n=1 Tax=Natrarchaeobius halalkaliphilus TaxID=1679091 RepID=UPI001FB42799|nr:hypothetical protein [Natrarchaeobius halalkaliphilus]
MSSRASALESPKASGAALEAHLIQSIEALEYAGDRTATWYDARTTTILEPSSSLLFFGIVLVEPDVPVEIKGCQIETSDGSRSTRGRFYVKRDAHEQLIEHQNRSSRDLWRHRPSDFLRSRRLTFDSVLSIDFDGLNAVNPRIKVL